MVVVTACSGRYAEKMIAVVPIGHKRGVLPVDIGIIFRGHVASASPCLITNPKKFYMPGILTAIGFSPFRHRAFTTEIYILHPLGQFLNRTTSHIAGEVGICANTLAEI